MSTDLHTIARDPAALTDPSLVRRVFNSLANSSVGREIAARTRESSAIAREAVGARIRALEARQDAELPPLQKKVHEARDAFAVAEAAYRKAAAALSAAAGAHDSLHAELNWRIEAEARQLEKTCDAAIDEALCELRDLMEQLRYVPQIARQVKRETFMDGSAKTTLSTNRIAIERRRNAIRAALDFAESLRREVDQSNVAERLASVIALLPSPLDETLEVFP